MQYIHIDFETRAVRDLLKVGVYNYSRCPSFAITWLSYVVDDGEVVSIKGPAYTSDGAFSKSLNSLRGLVKREDHVLVAHNAQFEAEIWDSVMCKKHGMPKLPFSKWRCTMASAMAHNIAASLGECAKVLDLSKKKDEEGKNIMLKLCKPRADPFNGAWYEDEKDITALGLYCDDDVRTERGIQEAIGLITKSEQKVWEENALQNTTGAHIDVDLCRKALEIYDPLKKAWNARAKEICGFNASQVEKLKNYLIEQKVAVPYTIEEGEKKYTLGSTALKKMILSEGRPHIKELLELRQKVSSTSIRKYTAFLKYNNGGKVQGQFVYHGASTGRWSSRGVQMQNIPRGSYPEDTDHEAHMNDVIKRIKMGDASKVDMDDIKTAIRGVIVPPKGRLIYQMDYSQIEARVLAWMVGEEWVLRAFTEGKDLYKVTASLMYDKNYDEVTKDERFMGKIGDLALQYRGGHAAFAGMAINYGKNIEADQAKKVVQLWRSRHGSVVRSWTAIEDAAMRAVRSKKVTSFGPLKFKVVGDFLCMKLPSGRMLKYYKPLVKVVTVRIKGYDPFDKEALTLIGYDAKKKIFWGRLSVHGGNLVENAAQAISADIIRSPYVNMRSKSGGILSPFMTVHDEVVAYGPIKNKETYLHVMKNVMLDLPDWAKDIPLDAEGYTSTRYMK